MVLILCYFGAEETLKKTTIIISEFFPETLQSSGYSPAEYLQMLTNHNFSVFYGMIVKLNLLKILI